MKYISPGSWFALEYPSDWREFEDEENSFLFYNPNKWSGNFRISAFMGESGNYAEECICYELKQTESAKKVKLGSWSCAYLVESFQENGEWYTTHIWVTGRGPVSVECSFTVAKGESPEIGEQIVRSLMVRVPGDKPWKEIIPVRLLEIDMINEYNEWAVSTLKKQLTKDFTASEKDITNLQAVVDSGKYNKNHRQAWESFGIAFGTILVNEMDGLEWMTVIDGKKEIPALRFEGTQVMIYPTELLWEKVKKNAPIKLKEEFQRIKSEIEDALEQV